MVLIFNTLYHWRFREKETHLGFFLTSRKNSHGALPVTDALCLFVLREVYSRRNDVLCVYLNLSSGYVCELGGSFYAFRLYVYLLTYFGVSARLGIWKKKKTCPSLQMSWHPKANYGGGPEGSCYSAFAAIIQGTYLQTTQDPGNIHL